MPVPNLLGSWNPIPGELITEAKLEALINRLETVLTTLSGADNIAAAAILLTNLACKNSAEVVDAFFAAPLAASTWYGGGSPAAIPGTPLTAFAADASYHYAKSGGTLKKAWSKNLCAVADMPGGGVGTMKARVYINGAYAAASEMVCNPAGVISADLNVNVPAGSVVAFRLDGCGVSWSAFPIAFGCLIHVNHQP